MAPPPGPYSGTSTLALVARASAFSFGLVYGSIKLKYLKGMGLILEIQNVLHEWRPRQGLKGKLKQRLTTEAGLVFVHSWFA
ncbi:hypothetical protein F383_09277 [Gossypium arboreum]|uniref:ATP synthase subunit e, mitochondrial n=1 Tax=Gossypium arboreum TaxID=29729 RepID=A0A0B0PCA2_GOSAR|nr:hypothetical protein F383_09277 [Gossypium arboreum]